MIDFQNVQNAHKFWHRVEEDILELRWDEGEKPESSLPQDQVGEDQVQQGGSSGRDSTGGRPPVLCAHLYIKPSWNALIFIDLIKFVTLIKLMI